MKTLQQHKEEIENDLDAFRIVLKSSVSHDAKRESLLKEFEELTNTLKTILHELMHKELTAVATQKKKREEFFNSNKE